MKVIYDDNISLKAKGIYTLLASMPIEKRNYKAINESSTDGRDSVRSGVRELIDAKYLTIKEDKTEGKFNYKWILWNEEV